jgi:hypothetical protein
MEDRERLLTMGKMVRGKNGGSWCWSVCVADGEVYVPCV